jgi:hypothetical protein
VLGRASPRIGHHYCLHGGVGVTTSFDLGAGMTYDEHILAKRSG